MEDFFKQFKQKKENRSSYKTETKEQKKKTTNRKEKNYLNERINEKQKTNQITCE